MPEVEVFRLTPEVGKFYYTAEYTKKVGTYPNYQYYTTNPLRYVGKFLRTERYGSGDGMTATSFFDDKGTINRVVYTYEGTTSFVELQGPSNENKAKKAQMTTELKSLPPMNQPPYPGGTNYHSAHLNFQSKGGRMLRSRKSRTQRSRTQRSRTQRSRTQRKRGLKSKRI